MTARLREILSVLDSCEVFADVGCDHGYIAKAMLDTGKAERVIISDISVDSLKKAQNLLKDFPNVTSVVSDGFEKIGFCSQALIAGLGGEEIVKILTDAKNLPEKIVVQPMKNADKVRETLIKRDFCLERDYVFFDKKYYFIIKARKGNRSIYNEKELKYGYENLHERPTAFIDYLLLEADKIRKRLERIEINEIDRRSMEKELKEIEDLTR